MSKLKFAGRELLNAYIFKNGVLPNLLQSIGRQFLENKTDALFLFSKELMGLFDHRQVSKNVIHARKKCYGCASHHGRFAIYPFSVAVGAWKKLCVPQKAVKEIKGIVAYAGKAFGHVVVVPMLVDTQEIAKISKSMKRGDVLVAESTTPELLVLCKKAAAIVTDQGGMLSHAAIVSRELGIPCIIGTGKATHIFKAGDVVEVDADRGTVRKMR